MRLRNKKTGEIIRFYDGITLNGEDYDSLYELNEEWEDVKEPLIKDEKVRKAVRAWADVNQLAPDYVVEYNRSTCALLSWQADIEFNIAIEGLEDGTKYTIPELCGEEEENARTKV